MKPSASRRHVQVLRLKRSLTIDLVLILHEQERVKVDVAVKLDIGPARTASDTIGQVADLVLYPPVIFVFLKKFLAIEELWRV